MVLVVVVVCMLVLYGISAYTHHGETVEVPNVVGMQESDGRRFNRTIQVDVRSVHFLRDEEMSKYNISSRDGHPVTNLEAYRQFLYAYLHKHPGLNQRMTMMVRQLAASDAGIPVEMYAFTRTKVWEEYEELQARLVEFAFASLSKFGLVAFQRGGLPPELLDGEH